MSPTSDIRFMVSYSRFAPGQCGNACFSSLAAVTKFLAKHGKGFRTYSVYWYRPGQFLSDLHEVNW